MRKLPKFVISLGFKDKEMEETFQMLRIYIEHDLLMVTFKFIDK